MLKVVEIRGILTNLFLRCVQHVWSVAGSGEGDVKEVKEVKRLAGQLLNYVVEVSNGKVMSIST